MADHASERAALAAVRDLLRRAVLTLAALPDPDGRFLAARTTWWPEVVRDVHEAYGYAPPRVRRFAPTPHDVSVCLEVLGFLAWHRRAHGDNQVRLFLAWALGTPKWLLGQRIGRSEDTVMRRIDELAIAIANEFAHRIGKILFDKCGECSANSLSNQYEGNSDSPSIHSLPTTPKAWIAEGERPSADETIPAVAADRSKLVERIERENRNREKAKKRERSGPRKI
jgi:hypothetical protein